ncbi:hypothetical protein A5724_13455 [Mycobacterium sp. ACS1612]|uniref:hypothetical protein n=1 Tax=Mycobacterium sp. ACS1612 TaxID=1834117 RepID=UPI0007FE08D3|nr:hypothetical protein [Mycobacterium sp. ACS1612]OBF36207.1 hypothetical protein A5724_13455 [Mycobacterium sp. ACS1612]
MTCGRFLFERPVGSRLIGSALVPPTGDGAPATLALPVIPSTAGSFIGDFIAIFISNGDEPGENGGQRQRRVTAVVMMEV